MLTWTLARKDLRLLLRDRRAVVILLAMPFIFILVLGVSLGEGFGQKPDDRLRVSLVDLDLGYPDPVPIREGLAWLTVLPAPGQVEARAAAVLAFQQASQERNRVAKLPVPFPGEPWAKVVRRDLEQTAEIRLEIIPTREEAERLVRESKRSAVLVLGPNFSERVARCSFLVEGINPFFYSGVELDKLDVVILTDPTQEAAAKVIQQVAQVTLLRVVLPWMIGRAFEKLGDPVFMDLLGKEVPGYTLLPGPIRQQLGKGVQDALEKLFPRYNLKGKTWADLTKAKTLPGSKGEAVVFREEGKGPLQRGTLRYQILVPSYTVMFAFFLVLTVGWLFVAERREGTLKRLRAAPLSRTQILLGKLIPCLFLSLAQGFFLLGAGKLVFGMKWGPRPEMLVLVVVTTSLAAMGMALLVAALARSETQVAIYGTLLVLVLAGISGCLMPRELMPEEMKVIRRITPHAWALDAYDQLLLNPDPNLMIVVTACAVLTAFGLGFVTLAWWVLRLD